MRVTVRSLSPLKRLYPLQYVRTIRTLGVVDPIIVNGPAYMVPHNITKMHLIVLKCTPYYMFMCVTPHYRLQETLSRCSV